MSAFFETLYPGLGAARRREAEFGERIKGVGAITDKVIAKHYDGGVKQWRKDSTFIAACLRAERDRIKGGRVD